MLDPHFEDRHRELAARVRERGERQLRAVAGDEEDPSRRAAEIGAWLAGRVVDRSVRIHGAQGLVRGSTVERLFREARSLRLREGTSEGLRLELAEAILKESR
jgi:acyl-CoA dehydrogenase